MSTKKILGLDLGTTSIGWAVVKEAINPEERSEIVKIGVRVNPLTTDEKENFSKGADITTNADRTLKRSMRRNLQRYKLRREHLLEVLKQNGWINDETILAERGNRSTFETWHLRAKAVEEAISLEELARVLLMINKKRGYKSSRKAKSTDEGELIDGMAIAKRLYENDLTPGELSYTLLQEGKKNLPDYYRSDLNYELRKVWDKQKEFYPEILTESLFHTIEGKNEKQTWQILSTPFNIVGIKFEQKGSELKKEQYRLRSESIKRQLDLERLAVVLQKINGQIHNSSGYLGAISDRSKELYFNNQTVGQYQMAELNKDPHHSLTNEVFYRADYIDEFERIWETQAKYHPELTQELKREIRDIVIFYQRPLKSQKGLISFCELESRIIRVNVDGKEKEVRTGCRVAPKSSPLFQEFKIWQILNNVKLSVVDSAGTRRTRELEQEERVRLADKLRYQRKMSKTEALKILLNGKTGKADLNYKDLEGNITIAALYEAYLKIVNLDRPEGSEYKEIVPQVIKDYFVSHNISTDILDFKTNVSADELVNSGIYKLWHLLYSYEGDKSNTGVESLVKLLYSRYGFNEEQAKILVNVKLVEDYGSLSTKAMRNILPYMREGLKYDDACAYAGYKFSAQSLTREEIDNRPLKEHLSILPKNSLRNPVVEKIVNQMINVVNAVVDKYGKPDEVRIELARELKKSADEREKMTRSLNAATREQEEIRKILHEEFGLTRVSRNDIIRYRLYEELKNNGYKTLYSSTYIPREKLFSKEFDIEHIIPQARLFDDSFANKTIEARQVNIQKGNKTAIDYINETYKDTELAEYKARIESLLKDGSISHTKAKNLLMHEQDIPSDFLNRDLSNSAYIAKKAREILLQLVREVHATTGSVTDRLRKDWQLEDMMQQLNFPKYDAIGEIEIEPDRDGRTIKRIKNWSKRNDHRHHAMDALTIAFTRPEYVNYLSNLNARSDRSGNIYAIEQTYLRRNEDGKIVFKSPLPIKEFRGEALRQLESVLVSIKAKNKVVTQNINKTKNKSGNRRTEQLTPRGQLHNETIYGSHKRIVAGKEETIYTIRKPISPDLKIDKVIDPAIRNILKERLLVYRGDAKKAFSNLEEKPIYLNKDKGITIKRVSIEGMSNVVALHDKKDQFGKFILDKNGDPIPTDFVSTSNNHHVAIFRDGKGKLQEHVVSFYEAVMRANQNLPIIDTHYRADEGWQFMFTMKQNEYFVFPNPGIGFYPAEIDLLDADNYTRISPYLYRVQKLRSKEYVFRHHLETSVTDDSERHRNITWKSIRSTQNMEGVVKVRINHIGEIVAVGEY